MSRRVLAVALAVLAVALGAGADEGPSGEGFEVPGTGRALPPGFADPAPLWSHRDPALQLLERIRGGASIRAELDPLAPELFASDESGESR